MNQKILGGVIPLLVLGVTWLWQQTAAVRLSRDNAALDAAQKEREVLLAENAELIRQRETAGHDTVPLASKGELLRLRNEVRQLRQAQPELERLRLENERLAAELSRPPPARLADMEGFVAQESWDHAGFATPEATLRTLFRALRNADVEGLVQCLGPEEARVLQRQIERNPESAQKEFATSVQTFSRISGYRIAGREALDNDRVTFQIQVAAGGVMLELALRRYDADWKVERMFQTPNRAK